MHPSDIATTSTIGETPEDGSSLRLVRLRLALTLIAVAIVPLAAVSPFVRTILDDPRAAQHEHLAAESEVAAAAIQKEISAIRLAATTIAADPSVASALGARAGSSQITAATAQLASLLTRPPHVVTTVTLLDLGGAVHGTAGPPISPTPDGPPPPAGQAAYQVVNAAGGGGARLDVAVAVPASAKGSPAGSVVATLPLEALLRLADDGVGGPGEHLAIVAAGDPIAAIAVDPSTAATGGPTLEFSGLDGSVAQGATNLVLPGTDAWQVVATAPLTVAAVPLPVLLTLVGLLAVLVAGAIWMARRIVEPAVELERQRTHFQSLYHTAREAALSDSLTGLGNHRAFQEAVARMVEQARRYGSRFGLVLLDIDEFKRVNDTRGHATGDELLAEVGDLVRATIRGSDLGFRIGGDEFAILMPETDAEGAAITARRILSRGLDDRSGGRYRGAISFSAGVTACPALGRTRVELTAQADAALYRGKRNGRTVVTIYDPEVDRGHVDEGMRAELSSAVAAVIESGRLTPVYQPIVHLPTGRILGYEGLVRVDPSAGFAHTGALFDAAEIAGRVLDLDRAALDVVLAGADAVPEQVLISLNVSPRSFEAPEFNATVFLAILRRHGVDPGRVLLELTERDAIRDPDRLRDTVAALQAAGVRVAADDVGAGNAGLRLLSQFRFDVVKIDLSLVQGGAGQEQVLSVLTSLAGLARRWGALTIAEGVETPDQLRMIRALEIDAGQGYLLGRPGAISDETTIDLDALGGQRSAVDQHAGHSGAALRPGAGPRPAAAFAIAVDTPGASSTSQHPAPSTSPVPTAASVLAGNGPSLFSSR